MDFDIVQRILAAECLRRLERPFTSASCAHSLFAAIPLSRCWSLLGYIDQGETRSVCSENDAPVQRARSILP